MKDLITKTGERQIPNTYSSKWEYLLFLRHVFAYEYTLNNSMDNLVVLEVGCGEGYGTNLLSEKAKKIIGIDVDQKTIEHCRLKYGKENCFFEIYDGNRIPFEDNTADLVVSFQVIEHVSDVSRYLKEIYRVMKVDARFFLTTPNRNYRLQKNQEPWNEFHLREYDQKTLSAELKSVFKEANVHGVCGTDEIQKIEKSRVLLNKLRNNRIQSFFVKRLRQMKSIVAKEENSSDYISEYSFNDYHVTKTDVSNSLDLFGICRK